MSSRTCVILPALNEADALGDALQGRPDHVRVVVVDNGSTDGTADVARRLGVEVVKESRRGFGYACQAGLDAAGDAHVVVFMDADATCDWADLDALTSPILDGSADLVLGRRVKALREPGAMPLHVGLANMFLGRMCGRLSGLAVHDIPPYRAARRSSLVDLALKDRTYGWPVEMVLKAGRSGLAVTEVPVRYRTRVGTSKVTGTVGGTLKATARMARVLVAHAWTARAVA